MLDGYFEVLLKWEVDLITVAVQIYFWHRQHTSHHITTLRGQRGFCPFVLLFWITNPRVSCEDRVLVDESDGNLLYHHVKSTTSNKNTKLHDLQAKETNQQNPPSFILVSEFSLSGILAVPEAAAAPRRGCMSCGSCSCVQNGWGVGGLC